MNCNQRPQKPLNIEFQFELSLFYISIGYIESDILKFLISSSDS